MPRLPIETAPRDGTLVEMHGRGAIDPTIGYYSAGAQGWVSYLERVPLVRHDVTHWTPIEDQAAAKSIPLQKHRRPVRKSKLVIGIRVGSVLAD